MARKPTVIDPLKTPEQTALREAKAEWLEPVKKRSRTPRKPAERLPATVPPAPVEAAPESSQLSYEDRLKADFRLFLIVVWRHLLGVDPAPIMLDMAYWLQHGPDRSIIMAFRGFSKSWITGAYALWRLYRDPQEKVMVVSGSLGRAAATTNWCLQLIMEIPILRGLQPLPHQRQSSKAFDVGPATPSQSPSFFAIGLGGQAAGWRASCIIPDDVETQTNSLTVLMRDKNRETVKEYDSIILPGGVIKYLGTPHDEDSLYNKLAKDAGYTVRIWPGRYPDKDMIRKYGEKLAPYILKQIEKHGPQIVGTSTMPSRFSDTDLAKRERSLGRSEFALQFMLDTSMSDADKYPLKAKDLMVMSLDPRKGPETVTWTNDPKARLLELPAMGFEGDYYHAPVTSDSYAPYTRIVGGVDNSGRGADEVALTILGELYGNIYWLHLWASKAGYEPDTLLAIAKACVRFKVGKLRIESNFGDGMFAALLRPVLEKEWAAYNRGVEMRNRTSKSLVKEEPGGTEIEEVRASNQMAKEKRILSILEPLTQQHRLVVDTKVLEWDFQSISKIEGSENSHRYAWGYQFTHLTRERDALMHDDRLDSLALAAADFADILGVDPGVMAASASQERTEEEMAKLLGWDDEMGLPSTTPRLSHRPNGLSPSRR